jgi:alpha-L-rhamnosidase
MSDSAPQQNWIGSHQKSSAPYFRHIFQREGKLKSASLAISGLGYHEAWMNGHRVGDHVLDPAQTDYEHRVLYVRHDVTQMILKGPNCIGAILGNGWYHQDRVWSHRKRGEQSDEEGKKTEQRVRGMSYGEPRLMMELELNYEDGRREVVRPDSTTRWSSGPITDNNIYSGEHYDARLELEGWSEPNFNAHLWEGVEQKAPPGGRLEEQTMPPMRKIEKITPQEISPKGEGRYVIDFGQNLSGWVRMSIEAEEGTEITLRYAETVFSDGEINTASTGVFATEVEQIDRYICRGGKVETWEPRFTYHGFRYAEVLGWPGELKLDNITAVVVHTDVPVVGNFACSDQRLNQLHQMALWTHRSNLHGIPEDCPVRERCGWLGDANLVTEYSLWNYDSKSFWEKFLGDIETTRADNGGIPCDIAPGKRCSESDANPDWAAAFIMLPWYLYERSGDPKVFGDHWSGMVQLMAHYENKSDDGILKGGYGDFFDPGSEKIVSHTPQVLSTTLWYFKCSIVMAEMAKVRAEIKSAERYQMKAVQISKALERNFFDRETGSFGSQGANVLALAFGVLSEKEGQIQDALVRDIRERNVHMNVGVMGVRYILEVLTEAGHGELALKLMHQNTYPSFGHLIERGATTLWECWGEIGHDENHGARSLSHPFMGGYDNWFFESLGGIQTDTAHPGFKHFFLKPHPIAGIDWVRCEHEILQGKIESSWRVEKGVFSWNVTVPKGTQATVQLPVSGEEMTAMAGRHSYSVDLPSRTS